MADILQHPLSERKPDEFFTESSSGSVFIRAPEGEVLTLERAIFLLERAKLDLFQNVKQIASGG